MKKYPKKIVYYETFDCDFAGKELGERRLPDTYKYYREGALHSVWHFIVYRLFATPLAAIYKLFIGRERIIGKKKLKAARGGFFIYGNHTCGAADAFIPGIAVFPRRTYTVVDPKNFSMPVIGRSLYYFGALPRPETPSSSREFGFAITRRIEEGGAVVIYPEAHLWEYASFIRPFSDASFTYPERTGAPAFAMTRVYRKHGKGYRTEVYIDGPFFATRTLSAKDARAKLAREIREAMEARSALSDIEIIKYERKS